MSKSCTIDSLIVKTIKHVDRVAMIATHESRAGDVGLHVKLRVRRAFDVLRSAVGRHDFIVIFVQVLEKWASVNHNVHVDSRDVWCHTGRTIADAECVRRRRRIERAETEGGA